MTTSSGNTKLEKRLRQVEVQKAGSYDKRTEHLGADGTANFINRLILEDSPYLLQHAHNPVNWFAWGSEAFEVARVEGKPIFLSIGYSTCHWCHVMEVESFDNVEVAKVLNKDFISIKMDREQYPDIDEIYMMGVQLMSGQGGWPMSNFLMPDGKPFFAATYFPAPSFVKLLQQIVAAWRDKYQELETSANSVNEAINRILSDRKNAVALEKSLSDTVAQALFQREDRSLGGLAGAPKFPQEPLLLFMLDRARRDRNTESLGFVSRALEGMGRGGIYDQVAGGFHRYSVDEHWLAPHFEKMLYNQSQLALVYLEAFQVTGNAFFRRICEQTLDYVTRDMQIPVGGFYSATDADSEGAEGIFFLWTIDELEAVLNPQEVEVAVSVYGVTRQGNFEGSNILNLSKSLAEHEQEYGAGFTATLDAIREKLYQARALRLHPLRDDKLIVAWSGAMITTLARAGFYFNNQQWLDSAEKAASFIYQQNVDSEGRLLRIYLNAASSIDGLLEDYANFIEALIALYDITAKPDYLAWAERLTDRMLEEFWDREHGGIFLSPQKQVGPQSIRSRNAGDGATLSPVSTALQCLVLLHGRNALLTRENAALFYREKVDALIASLSAHINEHAMNHTSLLRAIGDYEDGALDAIQYAGLGLAKITVSRVRRETESELTIFVNVSIAQGWHVTAPESLQESVSKNYRPIELKLAERETCFDLNLVDYPDAAEDLPNSDGIKIYHDEFELVARLNSLAVPEDELSSCCALELVLQLCNAENCLLPETLQFVAA